MKELQKTGEPKWKSLPDRYALQYAVVSQDLNDQTLIGCNAWSKIKIESMGTKYKQQMWYKLLGNEERLLLEELKGAQRNQGDLGPLIGNSVRTPQFTAIKAEKKNKQFKSAPPPLIKAGFEKPFVQYHLKLEQSRLRNKESKMMQRQWMVR